MKMLQEFKEFAMKGNVVDLAVGVIIGGAFGKIVTSLVNDVIMPPIGALLGKVNFRDLKLYLVDVHGMSKEDLETAAAIKYGQFINGVLDFIIVAFCVFMLVKVINSLRRKKEEKDTKPAEPTEKECPYCLSQIPVKATRCKHCTSQLEAAADV